MLFILRPPCELNDCKNGHKSLGSIKRGQWECLYTGHHGDGVHLSGVRVE